MCFDGCIIYQTHCNRIVFVKAESACSKEMCVLVWHQGPDVCDIILKKLAADFVQ